MDLFGLELWQIYMIFAVAFMALEMLVPGFYLLPIGIGAFITSLSCFLFDSPQEQFIVLGISLIASLALCHKLFYKRKGKLGVATGADALIGKLATASDNIAPHGGSGYVKLYGDNWRAINSSSFSINKADKVRIRALDGNKVIVERAEDR